MPAPAPRVTVVVPVYNRAASVGSAVDSILRQTVRSLEVVVVDDASNDATPAALAAVDDPRLRVIRHEQNRGAAAARNTGIAAATTPFVAFLDSDDTYRPTKLAAQLAVFDAVEDDVGVVYCSMLVDRGGRKTLVPPPGRAARGDVRAALARGNIVGTPAAVVRRSCFEAVGTFDEALPALQDWELWLRVSRRYAFDYVDAPLVDVTLSKDSITRNQPAHIAALSRILERHGDLLAEFAPEAYATRLRELGRAQLDALETHEARRHLRAALRHGRNPYTQLLYAAAHLPVPIVRVLKRLWRRGRPAAGAPEEPAEPTIGHG